MSERGSFVTEYIYCPDCLEAVKKVLCKKEQHLCANILPGPGGLCATTGDTDLPIIAGKIGGGYSGEEIEDFANKYAPELTKTICHKVRVAVIPEQEDSWTVFTLHPKGKVTKHVQSKR